MPSIDERVAALEDQGFQPPERGPRYLTTSFVSDETPAAGNVYAWDNTYKKWRPTAQYSTINFIIDGGGSALTVGQKGHVQVDFACTIISATLLADVAGAVVVDIWKDTYANFPPVDANDSITSATPPTIPATNQNATDSTLTSWTKTIVAGDVLAFNVDSCTTITRVTLALKVQRT